MIGEDPKPIQHPLRRRGLRLALWTLLAQLLLAALLAVAAFFESSDGLELIPVLVIPTFNLLMWVGLFLPWLYDLVRGRNELHDQLLFIRQLGDLLRLGLPVPEALQALATEEQRGWRTRFNRVSQAAREMASTTAAGDRLGESMARVGFFPEHWPLLLHAAESAACWWRSWRS